MRKTVLLVALCLSIIAFATPFAEGMPPKTANIQSIAIVSPQNATYNTESTIYDNLITFDIPLSIYIDVPKMAMVTWIGYSLNGGLNETISGDTIISVKMGHHRIVVYATDVSGNTYASETVYFTVTILCDVNGDEKVSIEDIVIISAAYGAKLGEPDWSDNADVAYHYGVIDIFDLATVIGCYGNAWPTL